MSLPNRSQLSDFRGAARMVVDAAEATTDVVEKMHRTIQVTPGPLGASVTGRTRGITGLVYRSVRTGIRLVGQAIDASLAPAMLLLPEGESSRVQDAYRSVANGVYGDYLLRTENPLAIDMSLHHLWSAGRSRRSGERAQAERCCGTVAQASCAGAWLLHERSTMETATDMITARRLLTISDICRCICVITAGCLSRATGARSQNYLRL